MLARVDRRLVASFAAIAIVATACAIVPGWPTPESRPAPSPSQCQFRHGFAEVYGAMPDIVGDCVEDESDGPSGTDTQQRTTNGLLVWRRADGLVAFTDGGRTWVRAPDGGVYRRGNDERFNWEAVSQTGLRLPIATPGEPVPTAVPTSERSGARPTPEPGSRRVTPEEIATSLATSGIAITGVTVLTADTDSTRMLGRAGSYVAKIVWRDVRAPDAEAAVELFPDLATLNARQEQLEDVGRSAPAIAQHLFSSPSRLALVRVPRTLSFDQARAYEAWLARL